MQNRRQRRYNLSQCDLKQVEKSPASIRILRRAHNRLCDAVEAGNGRLANNILKTMPTRYQAAIYLLSYLAKFTGWVRRPKIEFEIEIEAESSIVVGIDTATGSDTTVAAVIKDGKVESLIEVVQEDQLEQWRRGIAAMEKQIEENRPGELEAKAKADAEKVYGKRETLYFLGRKRASKEGEPYRVRVECISGLPESSMSVWADGFGETISDAADEAVHEARFRYAQALVAAKVEKDMEAGRDRAAKAELYLSHLEGV